MTEQIIAQTTDQAMQSAQGVRAMGELAIYLAVADGKFIEGHWELHADHISIFANDTENERASVRLYYHDKDHLLETGLTYRRTETAIQPNKSRNADKWTPEFYSLLFKEGAAI